jgi:hypothetical protein
MLFFLLIVKIIATRLFLPSASKRSNWLSAGFIVQKPVKLASFSHFDSRNGSCAAFKRPICPSESALRDCKNRLSALTNPRKRLILPFRCVGQEWPTQGKRRLRLAAGILQLSRQCLDDWQSRELSRRCLDNLWDSIRKGHVKLAH